MNTFLKIIFTTIAAIGTLSLAAQVDVLENGNVGIGNLTPQYKLDVNGSINFTDSLYMNGVPFTIDGGDTFWVYDATTGKIVSAESIDVQGDINYMGQLLNDGVPVEFGSESLWSGDSTSAFYGGKVAIGGESEYGKLNVKTPIGEMVVTDYGHINIRNNNFSDSSFWSMANRGSGNFTLANGPMQSNGTVQQANSKLTIDQDGNVGVGNNLTPTHKLDVDGDINMTGELLKDGVPVSFGGEGLWSGDSTSAHFNGKAFLGGGSNHRGGWSDLVIRDTDADQNSQLELVKDSSSFAVSLYDNDRVAFIGITNASENPQGGWKERMTLDLQNGNLGIGIANPSEKLHVVGDAYLKGNVGFGVAPVANVNVNGSSSTTYTDDGSSESLSALHFQSVRSGIKSSGYGHGKGLSSILYQRANGSGYHSARGLNGNLVIDHSGIATLGIGVDASVSYTSTGTSSKIIGSRSHLYFNNNTSVIQNLFGFQSSWQTANNPNVTNFHGLDISSVAHYGGNIQSFKGVNVAYDGDGITGNVSTTKAFGSFINISNGTTSTIGQYIKVREATNGIGLQIDSDNVGIDVVDGDVNIQSGDLNVSGQIFQNGQPLGGSSLWDPVKNNIGLGENTLTATTTQSNNIAIGRYALENNEKNYSIGIGYTALRKNTTGYLNVAIGFSAMAKNTTGSSNIALGYNSLANNENGGSNVAVGSNSLDKNISGGTNVAVGRSSLAANTSGHGNVAIGYNALKAKNTGNYNVAIGQSTLQTTKNGSGNVAIGFQSLLYADGVNNNTTLGYRAMFQNRKSHGNTAIGHHALYDFNLKNSPYPCGRVSQ